ncbi:MAG: hypothetical protein DRQ78_08765 [Epsilonproteobacteria bacterium]|nr:MAG: hypothetical protein DRQ78_08765 [Campylobacterota bacterium]
MTVTSSTTNSAPVADAGNDQPLSKKVGDTLAATLDGSKSSDADHDLITYSWTVQSAPANSAVTALTNPTSSAPTFVADEEGTYVLKLIVNDGTVDSAADTVTVTVSHTNSTPVADAGKDQPLSKKVGDTLTVTLDGSKSSDADNDPLTYSWSVQSAPANSTVTALTNPTSSAPTFIADEEGTYVLKLFVFDGHAPSAPDTVTVTVSHGNSAPVANAGNDQPLSKKVGSTLAVTLDGSKSSDADHDQITYSWTVQSAPANSAVTVLTNPTSAAPTFTADEEGTYVLKLIVNDGTVDSAADTVTITVSHTNSIPVADAGNDQHVKTHTATLVHLDGTASTDADGDTLTYSWSVQSKPAGSSVTLSDTTSAAPSFTPDVDGTYVFKLFVFDGHAPSAPATVTVTSSTTNAKPIANAGKDANIASHVHNVTALLDGSQSSDADHDKLTYDWHFVSKPTGSSATLSSKTAAKPSFVPDADGDYVLALVVNDGTLNSTEVSTKIHVTSTDTPPKVDAGKNVTAQVIAGGVLINTQATATDSEDSNLSYAWTIDTRPSGDTTSGFISVNIATQTQNIHPTSAGLTPSFRAMTPGQYVLKLTVSDNSNLNLSASDTMSITVTAPIVNTKPVADAGSAQHNVAAGSTVTLDASKSHDADSGDTITYNWTIVSDPSGSLSLNADTTQHPTFTAPTAVGDYVFKLVVNDATVDSDPSNVTVTVVAAPVTPPSTPTILSSPGAGSGVTSSGLKVPPPRNTAPITTPITNAQLYDDPMAGIFASPNDPTTDCTPDKPFLMQSLKTEGYQTTIAKLECVNLTVCYGRWWKGSSNELACTIAMHPDSSNGRRDWTNVIDAGFTCSYCVDPRALPNGDVQAKMNLLEEVVWDQYSLQW